MKAVVFHGPKKVAVEDRPVPQSEGAMTCPTMSWS